MFRNYYSVPYNTNLYNQRISALKKADKSGTEERFLSLIGRVTTQFEFCEACLAQILMSIARDRPLLTQLMGSINSRSTRNPIVQDFLEDHRPKRMTKRYQAILDLFARYKEIGRQRDEVAHSVLAGWTMDGSKMLILQPAWHLERKHVAGLPKYHYDIPALEALAEGAIKLGADLQQVLLEIGTLNTRRHERSSRRASQKRPPRALRVTKPLRPKKPSRA
jgi:hypothetical protein